MIKTRAKKVRFSTKICKVCEQIKPIGDFYTTSTAIMGSCKKCHNKTRKNYKITPSKQEYKYVKKPVGFNKLDKEIQDDIKECLTTGLNKKETAKRHNINYHTFLSWCKKAPLKDLFDKAQ